MLAGLPVRDRASTSLVLGPIALLCVYGIAKAIAGRGFAYVASALWVVAPLLAIPYFLADYHRRYVEQTLPAGLGLTTSADFPSMVAVLVAAYFAFRALAERRRLDALTRRPRGRARARRSSRRTASSCPRRSSRSPSRGARGRCSSAAPGSSRRSSALALWKDRGLGHLPLSSHATPRGTERSSPSAVDHVARYLPFDWHHLRTTSTASASSPGAGGWSSVARRGRVGALRRSLPQAALVVVWLASYVLAQGRLDVADFNDGELLPLPRARIPGRVPARDRRCRSSCRSPAGGSLRAGDARDLARDAAARGGSCSALRAFLALVPLVADRSRSPQHDARRARRRPRRRRSCPRTASR